MESESGDFYELASELAKEELVKALRVRRTAAEAAAAACFDKISEVACILNTFQGSVKLTTALAKLLEAKTAIDQALRGGSC